MKRVTLDLEKPQDLQLAKAQWKFGPGLVPGEPNEGLVAQREGSPARLADYDDSSWEICEDFKANWSKGLTFGWYRIAVTIPAVVQGVNISGFRMLFETCLDDYGEIWIDGQCNYATGTIGGFNIVHRVEVAREAHPGTRHVIACLAANGPLAAPGGAIFMRHAFLAFERYP